MPFSKLHSTRFRPLRYRPHGHGTWSGHLPFAADLVASLSPAVLVELGVHYGESYFGFCQSVRESEISCDCYGVDHWRGDPHAEFFGEEVFEDVFRYNAEHYGSFSRLVRADFEAAAAQFSDDSVDLLHIDGYHTYEAVRRDFETWFPKVRPGGIVLLHDTRVRHGDFGVWRLWEELAGRYRAFEFHHESGLGVLVKPGLPVWNGGVLAALFDGPPDPDAVRGHYELCAARNARNAPVCQVFWHADGGYSEQRSIATPLRAGEWERVEVSLPACGEGPLRLDPCAGAALVEIAGLRLRTPAGEPLWQLDAAHAESTLRFEGPLIRLPDSELLRMCALGDDPRLYLPELAARPHPGPVILDVEIRVDTDPAAAVEGVSRRLEECRRAAAELAAYRSERLADLTEMAQVRAGCGRLEAELETLRDDLRSARAACAAEAAGRQALLASWSWRITSPLRAVLGALLSRGNPA